MAFLRVNTSYLRHPKTIATFGVLSTVAGTIQDVFIQYAAFGHYLAGVALALFAAFWIFSHLTKSSRSDGEWCGIGMTSTLIFAIVMGGFYFWSSNYKSAGGVLATNFDEVEELQIGIDAMMRQLGVVKITLDDIDERTIRIEQRTQEIGDASKRIEQTTTDIRNRIEQDPETLLKDFKLTLDGQGYGRLLLGNYDEQTLFQLLRVYADYGLNLNSNATLVASLERVYMIGAGGISAINFFPSEFSIIGAKLILGEVDAPNLEKTLKWEMEVGLRQPGDTTVVPFDLRGEIASHECSFLSCYTSHLIKFRQSLSSPVVADFSLGHWAAIGGQIKSFKFLDRLDIPVNARTKPGYSPFDIAIQLDNVDAAEWILTQSKGDLGDESDVSLEILALKAMDGVDVKISAAGLNNFDNWTSIFEKRVAKNQDLILRMDRPEELSEVKQRVRILVQPHLEQCNLALAEKERQESMFTSSGVTEQNAHLKALADQLGSTDDLRDVCERIENHLALVESK